METITVTLLEVLLRGLMVGVAASITVGPVAVLCIQRGDAFEFLGGGLLGNAFDAFLQAAQVFCTPEAPWVSSVVWLPPTKLG